MGVPVLLGQHSQSAASPTVSSSQTTPTLAAPASLPHEEGQVPPSPGFAFVSEHSQGTASRSSHAGSGGCSPLGSRSQAQWRGQRGQQPGSTWTAALGWALLQNPTGAAPEWPSLVLWEAPAGAQREKGHHRWAGPGGQQVHRAAENGGTAARASCPAGPHPCTG